MNAWTVERLDVDDAVMVAAFFEACIVDDPSMRALPEDAFRAWAARAEPDLAGVRGDHGLIGFVYSTGSYCGREERKLSHFRAFVLPSMRRRGIGTALLAWVAALPVDGSRPGLQCSSPESWPAGARFLEHHGFTVFLDDLSLERPTAPVPDPSLPAGVSIRPFEGERDVEGVVRVHRAAYANDPVFEVITPEKLRLQTERVGFGLLLALDLGSSFADQIVGFCLSLGPKNSDGPHIESVAVHPDAGRRGIGRALLRAALQGADAANCSAATLDVHADNPARQLYESEGFVVVLREFTYRRDLVVG